MREFRTWAWAALVASVAAAPAVAQQGTVTGNSTGTTGGSLTGTGGLTGGGAGQLGGSGTSGGGLGGGELQGTALQSMQAAPQISAPTGTSSSALDKTNRFAGYYANPYFQGNTTQVNAAPGGFGTATTASATSSAGIGGTGGTSALGGRSGIGGTSLGGRGGLGGQNSANQSGILIPLQVQINYTARMQFPTPPVAVGKIQTDVRAVLDGTPTISSAKAVQILTDVNNNVTLRGTVKDDDESRLIEGIVRLTPGVGSIKNELAFPTAGAGKNELPVAGR